MENSERDLARQFEEGVQIHMDHLKSAIAFAESQALGDEEQDQRMTRAQELGAAITALEFSTERDIFNAMHSEVIERLQRLDSQEKN